MKKITIYLSSTYDDLKDYRRAVYHALRKSGYEVIGMEDYVATDERLVEACLKDIDERADIYVGIFAFRYGHIPPHEHVRECKYTAQHADWPGLSISELEFRYAAEVAGRPCLTFVAENGIEWDTKYIDAITERGKEKNPGACIDRLRNYLLQGEKLAGRFSRPNQLAVDVQASVARQLQKSGDMLAERKPTITWNVANDGSPYPGLEHFTRHYVNVFFGRELEMVEIIDRLHTQNNRFILISGDSGVGKSSFVDAGLLPRLEKNGLPDGRNCLCVRMVPSHGRHPFDALMRALRDPARQAGLNEYTIGEELLEKPDLLSPRIREIMTKGGGQTALVLFLDQMEELFTSQTREYAADFITVLCAAVQEQFLWVVATIRSDHLQHCYHHEDLLRVLRGPGHYPLGPVGPSSIGDIIKKPAQFAGLEITDRLALRIARESGSEPGSLPLLAFVLQRLYKQREGRSLSEAVYDQIGGVTGAVAVHVKTTEQDLRREIGADVKDLLPRLFQELLVVDSEGLPTRRRARLSDFADDLAPLVDRLIKARLFSTEGKGKDSTVSVAHEKLFEAWPALASWIAENKDDLRLRRQLSQATAAWEAGEHAKKYIWPDDRVVDVVGMLDRLGLQTDQLSDSERRFLGPIDIETMPAELDDPATSHERRATIGVRLSLLGDPRPGVGLRADDLPDIVWCEVPGGEITLELERSGKLSRFLGGSKSKTFRVEPFYIAKYPVTHVQYKAFREAGDVFKDPAWWQGLLFQIDEPARQFNQRDNHPAENLCWLEAVAFCRWLTVKLGYDVRLPTEWEWLMAATVGNPENEYPWGEVWDSSCVNTYESGLNRSTAVGMYPRGASPVGALDMGGNVWELCLNEFDNPRRLGVSGEARRVVRGGSWNYFQFGARAASRNYVDPLIRNNYIGFRVCCASPTL